MRILIRITPMRNKRMLEQATLDNVTQFYQLYPDFNTISPLNRRRPLAPILIILATPDAVYSATPLLKL